MPSDAFKTRKGEPPIEIGGVGIADDEHGVPLERAAQRMRELQDENGAPLTGKQLLDAANEWAGRTGLVVRKTTASGDEPAGAPDSPATANDPKE